MTITAFTSNQPRHSSFLQSLAKIADRVFAILECNTVFPGRVDDFFRKSPVMQDYFGRVIAAEQRVFGPVRFLPANVSALMVKMGDVSLLPIDVLAEALAAEHIVVFGASFIRPPLVDWLVERGAVNIHMGVSPWYRGSSTNFWAMYDRRPEYVGATIHRLSRGLDSGDMLFHAFPAPQAADPFNYGMLAVKAAQEGLIYHLANDSLRSLAPVPQDRQHQVRYTRNADFTDEVAAEYLDRVPDSGQLEAALRLVDRSSFLRPFILPAPR